jgi:hypothetical protein
MPAIRESSRGVPLKDDLLRIGGDDPVVVPRHGRTQLPVRVEGRLPPATSERRIGERLPEALGSRADVRRRRTEAAPWSVPPVLVSGPRALGHVGGHIG